MGWIVAAIAGFIGLYTYVSVQYRKEADPHLPYEASQHRGGHALREVGWVPFPNAYWLPGGGENERTHPGARDEISFEKLPRDHPSVREWSDRLPPLEQGEQIARIVGPTLVTGNEPYLVSIFWDAPEDFRPPQLIAFRRGRNILIVPRPPARFGGGSADHTLFIIPPEFLERGDYEILLSTEGLVNRWTFRAE
jgi:hypothetical protein